jgi:hypothetical protein
MYIRMDELNIILYIDNYIKSKSRLLIHRGHSYKFFLILKV